MYKITEVFDENEKSEICNNILWAFPEYYACGFRALEVFPLIWGKDNPCLFMAKSIGHSK